jgi:hypothetical protein
VSKELAALFLLGLPVLVGAFFWQPPARWRRIGRFNRRVRLLAYAYVASVLFAAVLDILSNRR